MSCVNKREDENETQTRKARTGLVKVFSLKNNLAIQRNPRLDWIMLHKIYVIYGDLKHQETIQALLAIQNLKSPEYFSPPQPYQLSEPKPPVKLQVVPLNLLGIQLFPEQVRSCTDIGLDPNGNWNNMVFTYKCFKGDRVWSNQTDERAPLWCTAIIFTPADGQCFFFPVVVHQINYYTQDLHFNIPSDWIVHNFL